MYVKIFRSVFDGSLYGHFEATIVFLALLVVADRDGIVDMTPEKLAAECGFPLDIIKKGLQELQEPDPRSRTPDNDGRRITILHGSGWGYQIVNYAKYRDIRSNEDRREYFRQHKQKQRAQAKSPPCPPESTVKHPSDADSYSDADSEKNPSASSPPIKPPQRRKKTNGHDEPHQFGELRAVYPKRAGDQGWTKALRACHARLAEGGSWEEIVEGAKRYAAFCVATEKIGTEFVKQAATFVGPDKHYRQPWKPPPNRKQVQQDLNISASEQWLRDQEALDAQR